MIERHQKAWVVIGDEDLLSMGTYETVSFVTRRAIQERLDEERSGTSADEAPDSGNNA
jgi:hypothetical protein